jgi:ABC-type hemin transport system ATPase subunit
VPEALLGPELGGGLGAIELQQSGALGAESGLGRLAHVGLLRAVDADALDHVLRQARRSVMQVERTVEFQFRNPQVISLGLQALRRHRGQRLRVGVEGVAEAGIAHEHRSDSDQTQGNALDAHQTISRAGR